MSGYGGQVFCNSMAVLLAGWNVVRTIWLYKVRGPRVDRGELRETSTGCFTE